MIPRYGAAALVMFVLLPSVARADCVRIDTNLPLAFQSTDLIFSGRLSKVEATTGNPEALTFSVNLVWKGPVVSPIVVYHPLHTESYRFQSGIEYVIFAHLLTPDERLLSGVHVNAGAAFGIQTCGGLPWPASTAQRLDKIVRPKKPRGSISNR
jgi:hypothetical protein